MSNDNNDKVVILVPIAMVRPSAEFIRAPSSIRPEVELSEEAFGELTANDTPSLVSFADDKLSNPQQTTTYTLPIEVQSGAKGWIGRFIVK